MESDAELDNDTWEIETILSHRVRRGKPELLVDWKGDCKPTWEPLKYLKEDVPELLFDYGVANKPLNNKHWQWAIEWQERQESNSNPNSPSQANKGAATKPNSAMTSRSSSTCKGAHDRMLRTATYRGQPELKHNCKSTTKYEQFLAGGNENRKVRASKVSDARLQAMTWTALLKDTRSRSGKQIMHNLLKQYDHTNGTLEGWNPMALAGKANSEDIPSWHEATCGPDAPGFWESMRKEIETLEKMGVWEIVDREVWMKVIPTTWAFRYKRTVFGEIKKLKSRLCLRGDLEQEGIHYWGSTYAPVVSWNTVRLMTMLQAQLDLASVQVDYVGAFTHADVEKPPGWSRMTPDEQYKNSHFCEMPRGFAVPGKVLRLKKNLYGRRAAPMTWFQHLSANLEKCGLEPQNDVDPCLFISDTVICIVYVDDTLLYAKNRADIDAVIAKLKKLGMLLDPEDDASGFLGVDIRKNHKTGEITLSQPGLIKKILEDLQLDDVPAADVPATTVLGKDPLGEPCQCSWNYATEVGKLQYIYGHSRPELGFSLSQVSRFTFCPKRSHELALIQIGRYLKGTADKGMILKPIDLTEFKIDVYVDADFLGIYGKESREDPDNVRSRGGHVIMVNGCPIVWQSKLIEGICMSTMMAEYCALSTAMRELLPLRETIKVLIQGVKLNHPVITEFHATSVVYEDNMGALTLAEMDPGRTTARSRFFDSKVHWFRQHVTKPGTESHTDLPLTVVKVDSKDNLSDIFTKPLPRDQFVKLRKDMIGW
jgi:hypothetical protein